MRIMLTGASGFIGRHLAARLSATGHEVLALSRSEDSDAIIRQAGAQPVRGNLEQLDELAAQLSGVEVLIHAAAPVVFWGPWSLFERQVVQATRQLLELAVAAGVRRFIQISSEAVLQDKAPLLDIDERAPYPECPNSPYGRSKMLAEQLLLAAKERIEVIILRPPFVWGPGSHGVAALQEALRQGKFVWIDGGRAPFEAVHVDNLAYAVVCALTAGRSGGIYFITDGEKQSVREFLQPLLFAANPQARVPSLPSWLLGGLATTLEWLWPRLGLASQPPLLRFEVAFLAQPRRYDTGLAARELGYLPLVRR